MSDPRRKFSAAGHVRRAQERDAKPPEHDKLIGRELEKPMLHFSSDQIESRIAAALRKKEKPICQRPTGRSANQQLKETNNDANSLK